MPSVGDLIDPDDYSGALTTLGGRATTLEGEMTGVLSALVGRLEAPNVSMDGRDGSINGSLTQLLVECGTNVGTTDGTGQITINFPLSFPHGVLVVIPTNGDTAAAQFIWGIEIINATGFVLQCAGGGGPLVSTAVRIDWIAIGW